MSEQIAAQGLDSLVLSDIAHVEMGQSPDSRYVVEDPSAGLPFLQGNAEFGAVNPEPKFGCLRPVKTCKANDVLISVRAPVGAVNLADRDYCIGRGLAAIRGRGIKPSLLSEVVARQSSALRRVAQGTTFEAISKNDLLTLKLSLPPRTDWPKIAQVLDTLDTAIHETEAIIAKLKAVKQGLLHDLLTRGIDANGELRPPQSEAPHLYKQSPLGWIPKEWGTPTLALVCSLIRDGTHLPPPRVKDGPLLLSVRNMQNGRFLLTDQDTRVSEAFYKQMHKHWEIQKGDVLLAIVGATIGKTAIVGDMPKFTLQRSVAVLRGKSDRLINEFLHLYLGTLEFQASLWARVNQTAQPGIYLDQLGAISIRAPLLPEQQEIRLRLQMAQRRIDHESDFLQKLRKQKAGLMDDLLTGRVRVTPLLQEAQQA